MSKYESILTIIVCAAMLGGCASIVSGTKQEVSFQSNPDEVLVTVSGKAFGKTPVTVQLDKKSGQTVVFSKEGYKPVTMQLTTTLDSWFWGNIVLGGFIGSTTDGLSGAVNQYSPSQYFVSLHVEGASKMESATLKSQRDKAKEFIVGHYTNLITDIGKGGGEDFSALMLLLDIDKDKEADALRQMRALSEVYTDAPVFADQVIAARSTARGSELLAAVSDVDSVTTVGRRRPHAHAVIIGIEQYRQGLPKADFALRDAKVMSEYLTKSLGYAEENVAVLLNDRAAKSDVEKYFERWLPNRVEKDDLVFVYYSGHGAPNPKTGEAYLVPYDGDPAFIDATGYPLNRLYEHLAKLPAKEVVVVLDSCFSGAGGRSVIAKGMRPAMVVVENPVLATGKTVVLAASAGDQVSSTYDQKGHGLLTYFFLKGLLGEADRNKDSTIELGELFAYLKPQVERVARREFNNEQTPQLIGSPELLKRGILLFERASP